MGEERHEKIEVEEERRYSTDMEGQPDEEADTGSGETGDDNGDGGEEEA